MRKISVSSYQDYRAYLRDLLAEKARSNPSFSLRAFARLVGMSPSHLSRALVGQKRLSASSAHQISLALNHSAGDSGRLIALIELEKAGNGVNREKILRRLSSTKRTKVLPLDSFRLIADWQHFAIAALTNTRGFRANTNWIAARLGLKPLETRLALDRLLGVGLLVREKAKGYQINENANVITPEDVASAASRENHKQHLGLAAKALDEVAVELREFNGLTLTMNLDDMPKAKKLIRDFVNQFEREIERKPAQEVVQLAVQLYPLTKTGMPKP